MSIDIVSNEWMQMDLHHHPHHYQQQQQLYSQLAPASGMLTRDLGQLTGLLPKHFLSTAAGFDSP